MKTMGNIRKFFLLLALMMMGVVNTATAAEAYAVYNNGTLTFYYDNNRSSRTGSTYNAGGSLTTVVNSGWREHRNSITSVTFDASFANARPSGTAHWFYNCSYITSITGIQNLNTSEVTNMADMFYSCTNLTSLDVSNFNTAKVTDMSGMFYDCNWLTSLDVSNFNTANVTSMGSMFYRCYRLTSIDVSNFNTANVTNMASMFSDCDGLTSINVSNFNTAKVTDMSYMFYSCSRLTSLDVSNFNTAKVTDMSKMFYNCSKLTTIYCYNSWSPSASTDMFKDCTNLVSQSSGLSYDSSKTDATYANPTTGYFTSNLYAVFTGSNNTLTFYNDTQRPSRPGISYDLNKYNSGNLPYWVEYKDVIQHVVFDPSFSTARPTTTGGWFSGMTQLSDITGLEYLHTENVTNMGTMFYNCRLLTNIDLTSFNTDNVTNMTNMFVGCTGLTSLDLSSFNTANVTKMQSMFNSCSNLRTIIVGDNWTTSAVDDSYNMFYGCTSIVGRNGTTFDANHVDKEYACLDNAPVSPGYLSDINHITPITYTIQVKIENARIQITYTNNGNTYTSTCEANRNITVDAHSNLIIRPYKTYNDLGLASVTLNGAEIIGNLTGSGTMYDAYTISDITSDVYLAFTGEEKVDVTLKVEASAPQSHFITNTFWVRPNYDENDNLYANQSATFTLSKYSNFFFEMDNQEDPIWGITWSPAAVYVNGKDMTADITYDMTTWFELESVTGDTEIRVVFEPNCDFVNVVSLGPDLLWTRFDGYESLIDCASEKYYVPVRKNGDPVIVRTNLLSNQTPDNYDVMYMNNYGRYLLEQPDMDQGGVEITSDHKNFQFMLFPNVKDQDRIIGVYPKATGTVPVEVTEWTVVKTAEVEDAEVRVSVEGGEEETTTLTDACTEIDVSNAEYAQLRVKGSTTSSTYDLYLNGYDVANHKLEVISAVRTITGLGLKDAKDLVEQTLPVKVKGFATRSEAEAAMATLTAIEGTQCSVKSPSVGTFVKVLRNGVDVTADMTPDGDYLMMNVDAADLTSTTWVITTEELINRFDTNNDGKVDISDVTKLVNKVLNE